MLSEHAMQGLRPRILTLRIIVVALSTGVLFFGIFAAVQNAAKAQTFGTNVDFMFLTISAPFILAGFIVPRLLPKTAATFGQPLVEPPEVRAELAIFGGIQTATIVGCAIFEGSAFLNLLAYFMRAELVHAAIAGLCWLCIVAHFPTEARIAQRIEDQLQRQVDEQQFRRD